MSNQPLTSVICAVWNQDPKRHELLRGHFANLAAQTRPVRAVYVFDNGDMPPADLFGAAGRTQGACSVETIVASSALSIYEAWNLALAAVRTHFVMNLNLDDRLSTDTVAYYEQAVQGQNVGLVGGDWRICYTQRDTDAVGPCIPATDVPFAPDWPPVPGRVTRLGSGTGERGTNGPACIWPMALHTRLPRYPYRTPDGTLLRGISDSVFWTLIDQMQLQRVRLPLIVGHYFSHPGEQAEFRHLGEEALLANGVSLI